MAISSAPKVWNQKAARERLGGVVMLRFKVRIDYDGFQSFGWPPPSSRTGPGIVYDMLPSPTFRPSQSEGEN